MHGRDEMELARAKAGEAAFELFRILDVPFFAFHDRDIALEGKSLKESNANVRAIADIFAKKMETEKVRLLWGTANLFHQSPLPWPAPPPIPTRTPSPVPRRR